MARDHSDVDRSVALSRPAIARSAIQQMDGYRSWMPGVHRGLPSPSLTLVFPLSGPLPIEVPFGTRPRPAQFSIPVGGLHTAPVYLPPPGTDRPGHLPGPQRGIQLAVHPLAARALFGLPAGALAGTVVELGDVVRDDAWSLRDQLDNAVDSAAAAAAVNGWVQRRLLAAKAARVPELHEAWRLIVGSGGRIRVADVASEIGWSRRHLTGRLRAEVGVGAKDLARMARFQRARSMLGAGRAPAEVAAACGYADQSHLSTEWRGFAGCTPGQWIAEELPYLSPRVAR